MKTRIQSLELMQIISNAYKSLRNIQFSRECFSLSNRDLYRPICQLHKLRLRGFAIVDALNSIPDRTESTPAAPWERNPMLLQRSAQGD
jgi:hypothetical protein